MGRITLCLLVNLFFNPFWLFSQNEFLDPTFGTNGIIWQGGNYTGSIDLGVESGFTSIVLQPDGMFITATNFHHHGADNRYALIRYNKDGILDPTFGEYGFVISAVNTSVGAIELQSGGKIIGLATEGIYPPITPYLFRYNADGSPDNSFGTNGIVTDTLNPLRLLTIQSDDKILVGKTIGYDWVYPSFTVERCKPDGTPDTDFGNNGAIDFSLPQANVSLLGIVSQADRKILLNVLVKAASPDDYRTDILFVRLNEDGSFDATFGEEGLRGFNFDDADYASKVLVNSDGKMVFLTLSYGLPSDSSERVIRLIRLNADGDLDSTFGTDGIRIMEYPPLFSSFEELENGKLMTIGTYQTIENPTPENTQEPDGIVISRYNWNGDLDTTFGQNGHITTTLINSRALRGQLVIQRDDKILVGATFCEAWMSCHPYTVVLRYDSGERLAATEFDKKNAFLVYPNPFKESVTIDFTLDQPEVLSMDLYSNDGRKVANLMENRDFQAGFNSQQLDFPRTLADGVYFLKVFNGNDAVTIKIVK
ncbi:T9SS type A sorting domain-containing protein [Flavobacterium enshiense]|uniref:Secretion system C-terminal sorting domain-containing protein n=1 Tax=Flavobacterium enshiense DK69 TaxID=1107311 RepID=A0A0A2N0W0_9FLAO|nr:T9SS type A sorting domain-containing protein [Flavobacterium enshiense]KGO97343.1 hypothetical protein Q767_01725 [Flavobacterium enshiense DK69]